MKTTSVGGGQNRRKERTSGRPSGVTPSRAIALMHDAATPPGTTLPDYIPFTHTLHIECAICKGIPERPLELTCGNIVCLGCYCSSVQSSCTLVCPCCTTAMLSDEASNHFQSPSTVTMSVLGNLLVNCSKGCNRCVRAVEYQQHMDTQCKQHFEDSQSHVTAQDISSDTPTTPVERRVAVTVIKRIMSENADNGIIKIPTQGRVSFMVCNLQDQSLIENV